MAKAGYIPVNKFIKTNDPNYSLVTIESYEDKDEFFISFNQHRSFSKNSRILAWVLKAVDKFKASISKGKTNSVSKSKKSFNDEFFKENLNAEDIALVDYEKSTNALL